MKNGRLPLALGLAAAFSCSCILVLLLGCALASSVVLEESRPTARPTTATDQRATGGELRLPGAMPVTFDPALSQDSTSAQYIVEVFSGLVTASPSLELVPDIAERYEVSQDGRTYRFHLRRNVRFHNGDSVTAQDVRFSIERSLDPQTRSPIASTYLGDIVGAREMLDGKARHLEGLHVIDDYTLEIEIDAPRPAFLAKLSHPVAFVVDEDSINSSNPVERLNGTGPFQVTEIAPGNRIVLEPNPYYYRDPKPALAHVTFVLAGGHPVTMYENGELDAAPVGTSDLPRVSDPHGKLSDELTISEQLSTFYLGLNCSLPPFDDIRVRQAFARALDRPRLVKALYEDTAPLAYTFVPPLMPDYDNSDLAAPAFDLERASELLAESRYGNAAALPAITLHISSSSPQTDPLAEAIAVMLEENLGVPIGIEQVDWSVFLEEIARKDNPYQMYLLGWIADYPDPENFLRVLFHSESSDNHSGYANPEVDDLLEQAGTELDPAERYSLYHKVEEIVLQEVPVIPLYHDVEYWLTKPYVRDMHYPALIVPRLQYVYLERDH